MAIEVRKVVTRKDLKRFIKFQLDLYKGNLYNCPPLIFDELNTLGKKKNPAFEHCEAEYWMAYRENKPVGRVAGIINSRANQRWNENLVRFGWIDFIDDPEVSGTLIETVAQWGKDKGMIGIQGPLGFTDMDPEGMLIEGFEELSSLAAIYNYPYYPEHMVKLGFGKGADWVQFDVKVPESVPEKVERSARIVKEKYNLRAVPAKKAKDFMPYTKKMFNMLNVAFDELYGYAALNERQMDLYIKQYFGFVRPEYVSMIIDDSDEVIAFGITIPDLTLALQKCNGRIFPFGVFRLSRALRKNNAIHMYLIGVRPDFQGKGALALVYNDLTRAYIDHGITRATTHSQLEDNLKAISIWKNYDGRIYARRRCWVKHF